MNLRRQKTMRRTKRAAETLAAQLRQAGHTDVAIRRVTASDWAITWTQRVTDLERRLRPGVPMTGQLNFDGDTFDPERDAVRLTRQFWDVWAVMRDGQWRTLSRISALTAHPEASVSARLRDYRKKRFGSHTVERQYITDGLWEYRIVPNPHVTVVEGTEDA